MLPFVAPLLLKLSPVGRILKSIPTRVWIGIAILLAIGAMIWWHKDKVSDARKEGYAAGVKYEGDRLAKKAAEIKARADKLTGAITAKLKEQNDAQNRAIIGRADDLRLSGPGKAACRGNPGIPASPGRPVASGGQGDVARPEMPSTDLAAVPWGWLVGSAERCDLNRAEVLSWREWHRQQSEAWAKLK